MRPAGEPAWIRFDNDGTFTGHAPCNGFNGRYEFDGQTLEIPETFQTAKACIISPEKDGGDDSIMRAERAILEPFKGHVTMEVTFSGPGASTTEWTSPIAVLTFRRR